MGFLVIPPILFLNLTLVNNILKMIYVIRSVQIILSPIKIQGVSSTLKKELDKGSIKPYRCLFSFRVGFWGCYRYFFQTLLVNVGYGLRNYPLRFHKKSNGNSPSKVFSCN